MGCAIAQTLLLPLRLNLLAEIIDMSKLFQQTHRGTPFLLGSKEDIPSSKGVPPYP
jgi:hypothetical protein